LNFGYIEAEVPRRVLLDNTQWHYLHGCRGEVLLWKVEPFLVSRFSVVRSREAGEQSGPISAPPTPTVNLEKMKKDMILVIVHM
jgi:hypothetical protein